MEKDEWCNDDDTEKKPSVISKENRSEFCFDRADQYKLVDFMLLSSNSMHEWHKNNVLSPAMTVYDELKSLLKLLTENFVSQQQFEYESVSPGTIYEGCARCGASSPLEEYSEPINMFLETPFWLADIL
jgi:hypothetical protein